MDRNSTMSWNPGASTTSSQAEMSSEITKLRRFSTVISMHLAPSEKSLEASNLQLAAYKHSSVCSRKLTERQQEKLSNKRQREVEAMLANHDKDRGRRRSFLS